MKVIRLYFKCSCKGDILPSLLYVVEDHQLMVEGYCHRCEKPVKCLTTLEGLNLLALALSPEIPSVGGDSKFLREMGIKDDP